MDKIICDLCGTSYPDTADQCPICGTARPDASKQQSADMSTDGYAYVRGGRFSKSNVRRRNSGKPETRCHPAAPKPARVRENEVPEVQEDDGGSNKGLIIVVVILLLAIIGMCGFVAIKFIGLGSGGHDSTTSTQSTAAPAVKIPCTGVTLDQKELTFDAINKTILLQATVMPADTTDEILFRSSNTDIVTVDDDGLVTPKADGEAVITVSCGSFSAQCAVVCQVGIAPPPTEPDPTEPPATQPVDPNEKFSLNRVDFTLNGYGATWDLTRNSADQYGNNYQGPADASLITWVSEDPAIATVENGVVTAVGNGKTVVTATYNGKTVQCIVRCANVEAPVEGEEAIYELNFTDVTIDSAGSLYMPLRLLVKETGAVVQGVTYRAEDEAICTVDANGRVQAMENTSGRVLRTYVYVEYEGQTYTCVIYVRKPSAE